jgi:hypothetical protein
MWGQGPGERAATGAAGRSGNGELVARSKWRQKTWSGDSKGFGRAHPRGTPEIRTFSPGEARTAQAHTIPLGWDGYPSARRCVAAALLPAPGRRGTRARSLYAAALRAGSRGMGPPPGTGAPAPLPRLSRIRPSGRRRAGRTPADGGRRRIGGAGVGPAVAGRPAVTSRADRGRPCRPQNPVLAGKPFPHPDCQHSFPNPSGPLQVFLRPASVIPGRPFKPFPACTPTEFGRATETVKRC